MLSVLCLGLYHGSSTLICQICYVLRHVWVWFILIGWMSSIAPHRHLHAKTSKTGQTTVGLSTHDVVQQGIFLPSTHQFLNWWLIRFAREIVVNFCSISVIKFVIKRIRFLFLLQWLKDIVTDMVIQGLLFCCNHHQQALIADHW